MASSGNGRLAVPDQRRAALKQANTVRQLRAETKRALKAAELDLADLLVEPPDFLLSASVAKLLHAAPGYGEVRVNRLLRHSRISSLKTVEGLSERQRRELVDLLRADRKAEPEPAKP
jgi:hypothetical protein